MCPETQCGTAHMNVKIREVGNKGRVPEGPIAPAGAFHKQRGAAAATTVTRRVLLTENL